MLIAAQYPTGNNVTLLKTKTGMGNGSDDNRLLSGF